MLEGSLLGSLDGGDATVPALLDLHVNWGGGGE